MLRHWQVQHHHYTDFSSQLENGLFIEFLSVFDRLVDLNHFSFFILRQKGHQLLFWFCCCLTHLEIVWEQQSILGKCWSSGLLIMLLQKCSDNDAHLQVSRNWVVYPNELLHASRTKRTSTALCCFFRFQEIASFDAFEVDLNTDILALAVGNKFRSSNIAMQQWMKHHWR